MTKRIEEDGYFWDEEANQWFPIGSEEDASGGVPITVIGGRSMDSGKLPEGFKDTLREMKKIHPHGKGADHLV
jgi:hypothetical protein